MAFKKVDKRTPVQKFLDFTGREKAVITNENIDLPGPKEKLIFVGRAPEINYLSNKFDGKIRLYKHKLKKHGKIFITSNGKTIIISGLNINVKKEGLTG